jgi:hypothetical protein
MKKIVLCGLCFILSVVITSWAQQPGRSDVSLLVPNYDLIPNEKIRSGDTVFGLYNTDLGYVLLPAKIVVETGVDDRSRKIMRIRVQDDNQPLFLIAGLPTLKPGKVNTLFSGDKFLFPGEAFVLASDDRYHPPEEDRYVLRAYGSAVNRSDRSFLYDYVVKLYRAARSQTLDYYRVEDDSRKPQPSKHGVINVTEHLVTGDLRDRMELPVLIWAGDVDRDDKPDLFMWWPCPGKDSGVFSLFLSSTARNDDLVTKIPVGVRVQNSEEN